MTILELCKVSHRYGANPSVSDVDLVLSPGEVHCLVGPSGSGKSTLLRLAAGLETLTSGEIRLDGERASGGGVHLAPEKRRVGMVFQDFALFPHMTVGANVGYGLIGLGRAEREQRVLELLDRVGLGGTAKRYPHSLSGGEQQRVALARALAPEPRLMLLDEPFSSLDEMLRDRVRDDTIRVLRELGVATLLVTHSPVEALTVADRLTVLRAGIVEQQGTPDRVYDQPTCPFVAHFLGRCNELRGTVREGRVVTALGDFAASELAEGAPALVLVRPEAVVPCSSAAGGAPGTVRSLRHLGATRQVVVEVGDAEVTLSRSTFTSGLGEQLFLRTESSGVHVFPAG